MVMQKLLIYLLFVVLAVVAAGLYGMLHNQISYTVSPEYFTKFKFWQFHLANSTQPERWRAALVGFLAAWWMGIPMGLLVGAAGFIHRGHRRMLRVLLWSLPVTVGFTLLFGLGGLLYGFLQTTHLEISQYANWYIPENVTDLRRYVCAGYMHNSSYLGGLVAVFVAWTFHIVVKLRTRETVPPRL
jgi:hypothetical protein